MAQRIPWKVPSQLQYVVKTYEHERESKQCGKREPFLKGREVIFLSACPFERALVCGALALLSRCNAKGSQTHGIFYLRIKLDLHFLKENTVDLLCFIVVVIFLMKFKFDLH